MAMLSFFVLCTLLQTSPFQQLQEKGDTLTTKNIYFEFNKATLHQQSYNHLDSLANYLTEKEHIILEIGVHTDYVNPMYSTRLTAKRAERIKQYLVTEKQIKPERLYAIGYGDVQPIITGKNLNDRQKDLNRRVVYKVLDVNN